MGWSVSALFQKTMRDMLMLTASTITAPTTMSATGLIGDSTKFALYGNTGTPDKTVATATLTAYNGTASQWVTANESTATSGYTAGGSAVPATKVWSWDSGSSSVCFQAGATTLSWTVTGTLTAYGGLLYDATITTAGNFVANQGICFNYFGGSQSVTGGTFCTDAETEILTGRGWLRYDQVAAGDTCLTLDTSTGLAGWQPVMSVHIFDDGPYDVIRMEGPSHSSVTTPDHRWPAVIPGADGIRWYTTQTLPPDAQLCISESERTDKVADLAITRESADLVWCVRTANQSWLARHDGTRFFTGNTVTWATVGLLTNTVIFNITV